MKILIPFCLVVSVVLTGCSGESSTTTTTTATPPPAAKKDAASGNETVGPATPGTD